MEEQKRKKALSLPMEILIILIVVVGVRTFVFGTIGVKGSSMEPAFTHGDVVTVNKLAYVFTQPKRGDIVICQLDDSDGGTLIKRVIGLPGDEIEFKEKDTYELEYDLYINEELQEEDNLPEPIQQPGNIEYPYTVPENSYFVMGDNRNASTDSRNKTIGAIEKSDIKGKVFFRVFPFQRFGTIK